MAVVETLVNLSRPGWDIIKLRGNHEQFVLEYLADPEAYQAGRMYGFTETLLSYGVKPPVFSDAKELRRAHVEFTAALPRRHWTFLTGLPHSHVIGDYFFVHAGVRPGISLDRQSPEDMLGYARSSSAPTNGWRKSWSTAIRQQRKPVLKTNRIGIDTGAYATNCLTAVKLAGEGCMFLSTDDT